MNFFRITKSSQQKNVTNNIKVLSLEKREFLEKYSIWLKEFGKFVTTKNPNTFDIEQNKKIMELAAKIKKEKDMLEAYMIDPVFADEFNELTKDISSAI